MIPSKGLAPQSIFAGQFRVIQSLAQGGMGTIYQVEQLPTGHPRALKVILPEYAQDPRARARFEQEARIAARIESEHVAQVIAAGVDPETNTPWLAMELLQGKDLAAVLTERGRLPPAEVFEMLKQLGHALAAAHRIGVIHRDLKPENVFVATSRRSDGGFTVKVLDFGVAKWLQESRPGQATAVVGSPLWMAPEQLDARGILGPHTDIWALGLLAFAMLAGKAYWKGAAPERFSLPEVVGEIMAAPMVPASQRAAELGAAGTIPPGFDAWFARCVERDGSRRFRDVNEALAALTQAVGGGAPLPATSAVPAQPTPTPGISPTVAVPMVATPMPVGLGAAANAPSKPGGTMAWTPGTPPFPTGPSPFPTGPSPFQGAGAQPFQPTPMPGPQPPFQPAPMPGQQPFQPMPMPAQSAFQSSHGGGHVYGAGPSYQGNNAAPWQSSMSAQPARGASGGVIAAIAVVGLLFVMGGVAGAWFLFRPADCASNEHRSDGHCCASGAEWDSGRRACVCQNLALCGGPTVATNTPPVTPPPTLTPLPPPQYPTPQAPPPEQPPSPPSPTYPPPRPTPTITHACDGSWGGSLIENTGSRGTMSLTVNAASGACARWTEHWGSGATCHYVLTGCTVTAAGMRGVGRTSSPGCTGPVSASISCSSVGAAFREQVGGVVDSAMLSRR